MPTLFYLQIFWVTLLRSIDHLKQLWDLARHLSTLSQVEGDLKVLGYAYANMLKDRRAYDKTVETSVYVRFASFGKIPYIYVRFLSHILKASAQFRNTISIVRKFW